MALTPPFDTVDGFINWLGRPLTPAEAAALPSLLLDASQAILDADKHGVLDDQTTPSATVVRITRKMTKRALPGTVAGGVPVTQGSQSWGPFSQSQTYANPAGDIYLAKQDKIDLGFLRQRAGSVDMWAGAYDQPTA